MLVKNLSKNYDEHCKKLQDIKNSTYKNFKTNNFLFVSELRNILLNISSKGYSSASLYISPDPDNANMAHLCRLIFEEWKLTPSCEVTHNKIEFSWTFREEGSLNNKKILIRYENGIFKIK